MFHEVGYPVESIMPKSDMRVSIVLLGLQYFTYLFIDDYSLKFAVLTHSHL